MKCPKCKHTWKSWDLLAYSALTWISMFVLGVLVSKFIL